MQQLGRRIIVIGSPGSGKSYFSAKLSNKLKLPLYHMDNMYWHEDQTHITRDELILHLLEIMKNDEWILDGNYMGTMELRMEHADTVIYLDFPLEVCLEGIRSRVGIPRADIPWVEKELTQDFLEFVEKFGEDTRPAIERLFTRYQQDDKKRMIRCCSREELQQILSGYDKI